VYGPIFIQFCAVASTRRIFSAQECVLAVRGRSGSSKVDDVGTNRKRVCDFLLVGHCDWCYLAPFLRYGDLLAKNCLFFLPLSHSAPSLPICSLWNFAVKLSVRKLESWGYPPVKTPWS